MKKEKKEENRKKRWPNVIKLKKEKYELIKKRQQEFGFKTLAGTLDKILNEYEKHSKSSSGKILHEES